MHEAGPYRIAVIKRINPGHDANQHPGYHEVIRMTSATTNKTVSRSKILEHFHCPYCVDVPFAQTYAIDYRTYWCPTCHHLADVDDIPEASA